MLDSMLQESESDAVSAVIRAAFALISMGVNTTNEQQNSKSNPAEEPNNVFKPSAKLTCQQM